MTEETKDKNKQTKARLLSRIGNNLKSIAKSTWNIIKMSVRYFLRGLSVPAVTTVAAVLVMLAVPFLLVGVSVALMYRLFNKNKYEEYFKNYQQNEATA